MGSNSSVDPDARLMALAGTQFGVFTRSQAFNVGFTARQVDRRLATGWWVREHAAVYRLAATPPTHESRALGACFACGPEAVVSHRTAAELWKVEVGTGAQPEVTVPAARDPHPPGVTVYRSRHLTASDAVKFRGMPVTSPARTLVDLARVIEEALLEEALDDLVRRGLVKLDRVVGTLSRPEFSHRKGTGALRRMVGVRDRSRKIGSHLETRLFRILREASLPEPQPQYWVKTRRGPRRIDFAYPEDLVALETDGYESHTTRERFDDDRARRADLQRLGFEVVQITWTMLKFDPPEVVRSVSDALGLIPARWKKRPSARKR